MAKEIYRFLLKALLLVALTFTTADALTITTTQKLVVLDPGHGGSDPGITSTTNVSEKHITMKLAQLTAQMLDQQYRVLLTRTTDQYLPTVERAVFANQNRADLFISLHLHSLKKNKGFFFFFDTPGQKSLRNATWKTQALSNQDKSRQTAALFAKKLQTNHKKTQNKKGKNSDDTFSGPSPAIPLEGLLMPAILAEPFTISHFPVTKNEQEDFLTSYARILAHSIEAYFQKETP